MKRVLKISGMESLAEILVVRFLTTSQDWVIFTTHPQTALPPMKFEQQRT